MTDTHTKSHEVTFYSKIEEDINVFSHAVGAAFGVVALVLLIIKAAHYGTVWHIVSFSIFGASLVILYTASTFYHSAKNPIIRKRLKVFDHAAIYVLIAGTYTPFCLVTLNGAIGWVLFGVAWGIALIGIILKLFFTGRFNILSTVAYVVMGWIIVFAYNPLAEHLAEGGLKWLMIGGISYTVGAILYAIHQIKYNHAIFHIFVLMGSISHFISVYYYVLQVS